jgi:hypothetical protein
MPEITLDEKIAFLKHLFPKPIYNMLDIAKVFGHRDKRGRTATDQVSYWFLVYSVPTFKITGTPYVTQENLINMILKADKKKGNPDRLCGLEFIIEDMKQHPGSK